MRNIVSVSALLATLIAAPFALAGPDEMVFVDGGVAKAVRVEGRAWVVGRGYLEGRGTGNYLWAAKSLGPGDFRISAELEIRDLTRSAATVALGDESHFGFEGGHGRLFVEGPLFGAKRPKLPESSAALSAGKRFQFQAARRGEELTVSIDGHELLRAKIGAEALGPFGLRPWRSTMRVYRLAAAGNLVDSPKIELPPRTQPDGYTIPTVDLSEQHQRQVIVERIPGQYLGHPTTVLMADGRTMYCTYPLGHGGPAAVLKRSDDGGLTWGPRLPVPENWATATNCPCLHRLTDPQGRERLFVFEGAGAMRQALSEDGGKTWTPFAPNGLRCVVAPITIVPIAGNRLLGMYHQSTREKGRSVLTLWQAISADGGLTWSDEREVARFPGAAPCEPFVVRSPDGKQLAALARENNRKYNSLLITSNDEGKTWTTPAELPASLTGDRHMGRYAPDGRLVICFRDTALASPTAGDFVAWVGTYEDIVRRREGQYRVRLLRSPVKGDLGYPGVDVLPDGTFVATTYAVLAPGEKQSVVSVRFKVEEIDAEAHRLPRQAAVFVSGEEGYNTYRIPAMVVTTKGTVLAFCEGRKLSSSDTGDIDLLLKRSTDGGRTFSRQQVVWDDGENVCGNPCPVVDRQTGVIWLLLTHNLGTDPEPKIIARTSQGTRTVWVSRSTDDGLTWSKPEEITVATKKPDWTWYATGPGAGIQLRSGRLLIPCDHIEADTKAHFSHVIYSDDHGATWKLGGRAGPDTNECEAVELADGSVMLNMRNYDRRQNARAVATSRDGGLTWGAVHHDPVLVEPICQASIRRLDAGRIVFSNPAEAKARKEMTLRISRDEGRTWPVAKVLWPGAAAYSCLAVREDGKILCLYERGVKRAYDTITLAEVSAEWLEGK